MSDMHMNRKMLVAIEEETNPSFSKIFVIREREDVSWVLPVKGLG